MLTNIPIFNEVLSSNAVLLANLIESVKEVYGTSNSGIRCLQRYRNALFELDGDLFRLVRCRQRVVSHLSH
jgi:hypothetical protein